MNTDQNQNKEPSRDSVGLRHSELTERIIGVFYETYNELGQGFLESVYSRALEIALTQAGLKVAREFEIPVWFRGQDVGEFRGDLLVEDLVLLELKAADSIHRNHEAQIYNYLRATRFEVGLLLNFGPTPTFKRVIFDNEKKKIRVHPRSSAVGIS